MVPAAFIGKSVPAFVESALQTLRWSTFQKGFIENLLVCQISFLMLEICVSEGNTKMMREVSYFHIWGVGSMVVANEPTSLRIKVIQMTTGNIHMHVEASVVVSRQ